MRKWVVTTREVHKYDYEVFAETAEEAKERVLNDKGIPVPADNPLDHKLCPSKWDVRLYAPISSQRLPNTAKVRDYR
jgi:hypothetical protein